LQEAAQHFFVENDNHEVLFYFVGCLFSFIFDALVLFLKQACWICVWHAECPVHLPVFWLEEGQVDSGLEVLVAKCRLLAVHLEVSSLFKLPQAKHLREDVLNPDCCLGLVAVLRRKNEVDKWTEVCKRKLSDMASFCSLVVGWKLPDEVPGAGQFDDGVLFLAEYLEVVGELLETRARDQPVAFRVRRELEPLQLVELHLWIIWDEELFEFVFFFIKQGPNVECLGCEDLVLVAAFIELEHH
jgi:hypothetical protein